MSTRWDLIRRSRWAGALMALAILGLAAHVQADDDGTMRASVAGTVVDEAGKPVAAVRVSTETWEPVATVTTASDGTFRVSLPTNQGSRVYATLVARSDDGRRGVKVISSEAAKPEPVSIVVKPARPLQVLVVDGAGQPIAGAETHVLFNFGQVASGQTDAAGQWSADVPADLATAWRVYALKSKVGFDYAQAERARGSAEPPLALPDRLTLTLDVARPPLRIKTVDQEGKPLAGVEVGPWLIQKPGHDGQMNGISAAFPRTDAAGVATIDWLPARVEGKLSIVSYSPKGYYAPDHATWIDADPPVDEVVLTLLPLERLSGRVTTGERRPAAGATVRVEGQGAVQNGYRGETRTDANGRFQLNVHSEQAYILTASKDDLAAPYRSGVVVRTGKPVDGVDLVLGPGTRLKGRVTVGKGHTPAAQVGIAAVIDKGTVPPELKREGERNYHHPMTLWTWTQTDSDGRYEFLLGPGEYRVQGPPHVEPIKLTIPADNPPRELVRDFSMPRAERGPFAITVVDESGKPVANAEVDGAYHAMSSYFTRVVTNAQGTIRLERSLDPLFLVASTPERTLVGTSHVNEEATEAKVVVKTAASASGRLVDPQGNPIVRQKLTYGIRVQLGPNQSGPFSYHFGGTLVTDAAGEFQLNGLLVGESYSLQVYHEADGRISVAKTPVQPAEPGRLALGDVAIDLSRPKPYVPPTPVDRTKEAFAARKEKTPREKLDYTLTEARREYTRPLLLFGNPKDPACVELFRLFNERSNDDRASDQTPADLRWEFELAALDSGLAGVQALAKDLGITPDRGEPPYLAVLSNEGKLAATYPLRVGPDKKLDPRALSAFLLEHKLATRDAQAMLSEGLVQAKEGDRRVFLIMSASWCGPCRLLARFLTANKPELGRHYVFVKLDVSRDARAQELCDRYEGKDASNGIPWYVILDAAGKPLITSNAKEKEEYGSSNIGFPSSKSGIDHFMSMLRETAPRLSEQVLASLRKELEK